MRPLIPLAAAVATAAAFCWMRQVNAEVSPIVWLTILAVLIATAAWNATGGGGDGVRLDRVWPEWAALLGSAAIAYGRAALPDLFNADLESGAIVYVTAVVVLFASLRKTVLGHRTKSPWTIAHAFTCIAATVGTIVVSAAILYLE